MLVSFMGGSSDAVPQNTVMSHIAMPTDEQYPEEVGLTEQQNAVRYVSRGKEWFVQVDENGKRKEIGPLPTEELARAEAGNQARRMKLSSSTVH